MILSIIRGYKLILWGNRLEFKDTSMIDPKGINYVHSILPTEDEQVSRVVVFVQTRDGSPRAMTFEIENYLLKTLVESFEVES